MDYITLLGTTAKKAGNCACMGIDPNFSALPEGVSVQDFFCALFEEMDKKGIKVAAIKPNIGYFSRLDKPLENDFGGSKALAKIIKALPSRPMILDAKRGDIGNTARMYAKSLFETFDFDAVTLSPYMGSETVTPFLEYPGRFAVVVALSSNPSSSDFQTAEKNCKPLYRAVIEKMMEISTPDNMMFVIGATKADKLKDIRSFCPDNFFLVPGVGAQGGSAEEVIAGGANSKGGLLINSSRGIIYASSGDDFADAAAKAAKSICRI